MRLVYLFYLIFIVLTVRSQNLSKETVTALTHIKSGNIQQGMQELINSANANDLPAQFFLALLLETSEQKDYSSSFNLYRRAANRGLPDAMYKLYIYYENGIGITQNSSEALKWLDRFNKRGGKNILPDFVAILNEGNRKANRQTASPIKELDVAQFKHKDDTGLYKTTEPITHNVMNNVPKTNNDVKQKLLSDVDINIPKESITNEHTFAVIIANEHYQEESQVEYAINDGKIFKTYCQNVLGLPKNHIRYRENATLNNILAELDWMNQIASAYGKDANFIFYYAGHGIPDEASGDAYLLPVDGRGRMLVTGYSLKKLYDFFGELTANNITVFMDACFSGTKRDGNMLVSARGIAIKAKPAAPKGNMIVLSAAQGDETAYPYKEKGHGLFTYYLLKKLQETKGNVTMGELSDYITSEVKKKSIVENGKLQTPTLTSSSVIGDTWRNWKLK